MASSQAFIEYLQEQLTGCGAGEIYCRKMFGEYGIYCDGVFFGLVCDDQFFVKITDKKEEVSPDTPPLISSALFMPGALSKSPRHDRLAPAVPL